MFFWRKGRVLSSMIEEYLRSAEECLNTFLRSFGTYFEQGLSDSFVEEVKRTHAHEAACDDLRRNIEEALYKKALIPESRGDILNLLEVLDKVPNKAESVLHQVQTELLRIPSEFAGSFRELVHVNHEAFLLLMQAVRTLFTDLDGIKPLTDQIDQNESKSDRLERAIIQALFLSPGLPDSQKILLKELVIEIGNISDACENAADTLVIIAVKRPF